MILLPIVGRELRVAARRRSTYWTRALAGLAASVIFAGAVLFQAGVAPKEFGRNVFNIVAGMFLLSSLVAGVRYTADCLSEEKREGTLGLLFLTDLRGYDVVIGKLAATSLNCVYGLMAIFPVLAIPLLMGGVALEEFWRMTLVLANTIVFSLSAGIWVSTMSRHPRKAMAATLALVLLTHAGMPAIGAWQAHRFGSGAAAEAYLLPSVGYAFYLAFDAPFAAHPGQYLKSMSAIHGLSWMLLALASIFVRHSWQDKPDGVLRAGWRRRWQRWCYGTATSRSTYRARLLNINPCFWLGARQRLKPAVVWTFLGLAGCFWFWAALKWRRSWLDEATYMLTALFLHGMLKFWITSEACQRFGPDHRAGALELVLSTPMSVREILRGQMLALRRQFLWPLLLVAGIDVIFMAASMGHSSASERAGWIWFYLFMISTLLADSFTLCWTGMWVGLKSKRPNRATAATIARVLLLPWGIAAAVVISMAFTRLWRRMDGGPEFFLGLLFVAGLAVDTYFYLTSRRRLLTGLRSVATQRFLSGRALPRWTHAAKRPDHTRVPPPPLVRA